MYDFLGVAVMDDENTELDESGKIRLCDDMGRRAVKAGTGPSAASGRQDDFLTNNRTTSHSVMYRLPLDCVLL